MLVWITIGIVVLGFALYWLLVARYGELITTANARDPEPKPDKRKRPIRDPDNPFLQLADIMMVFVSVLVLCSSLFIILSGRYDDAAQKWAFGSVGSIFGFWCRRE
jgi:hypothetical protein